MIIWILQFTSVVHIVKAISSASAELSAAIGCNEITITRSPNNHNHVQKMSGWDSSRYLLYYPLITITLKGDDFTLINPSIIYALTYAYGTVE